MTGEEAWMLYLIGNTVTGLIGLLVGWLWKGRSLAGFLWGFFLGFIGVFITCFIRKSYDRISAERSKQYKRHRDYGLN